MSNTLITAERYHDFSCGHRVHGHESKCANLHGHNYRVHFEICAKPGHEKLDMVNRVFDFSAIKDTLCQWVEDAWDHRLLLWDEDPLLPRLQLLDESVVGVPFNPTAEGIAEYLLTVIGPLMLPDHLMLASVKVEETRKCLATAKLSR